MVPDLVSYERCPQGETLLAPLTAVTNITIATFVQVKGKGKRVFVQATKAYWRVKDCLSSLLNSAVG
jgi:hypothetical protein